MVEPFFFSQKTVDFQLVVVPVHKDIKFTLPGIVPQQAVHQSAQGLTATVEVRTGEQVNLITARQAVVA